MEPQVDRRVAMEVDPADSAFIWGDRNALGPTGSPVENTYREVLRWGPAFTDLIALTEPCLATLFGVEFRLDHYYLNLLRRGNPIHPAACTATLSGQGRTASTMASHAAQGSSL